MNYTAIYSTRRALTKFETVFRTFLFQDLTSHELFSNKSAKVTEFDDFYNNKSTNKSSESIGSMHLNCFMITMSNKMNNIGMGGP